MISSVPTTNPTHSKRPSWQCRFTDGQCTNPRVTMITGQVHDLCEEHRLSKTPSTRRLLVSEPIIDNNASPDDWEYQPMNGGDWKLTSHDLARDEPSPGRGIALADGVVFGSMFFHADVEALHVCSPTKCR